MLIEGKMPGGFRADRILVIQLGDIGDVVLTTPTFRALKETYPPARISALVRKGYGCLVAPDPNLSEVIEVGKSARKLSEMGRENMALVQRLRRARYDLAIDLRTGDRGAILAFLTGAPVRISLYAYNAPFWRNRVFNHLVRDPVHALPPVHPGADQSLRIVRAFGVDTADTTPRIHVSQQDLSAARALLASEGIEKRAPFATINPFSRWKYKEWGYDKWTDVIGWLWEKHRLPSLIVGSKEEAENATGFAHRSKTSARSVAGRTTLAELAALLSLSSLHIGVDSAAPHIAAAVGTPTITIFGPSDWRSWTVQDPAHRVVAPAMECAPCRRKGCEDTERSLCLEELEAGDVIGAVQALLGT